MLVALFAFVLLVVVVCISGGPSVDLITGQMQVDILRGSNQLLRHVVM